MSLNVAIDIGGTHIRVAIYQPDSLTPIAHERRRSLAHEPGVYDRLEQAVESVWPREEVSTIGIASPGPLDPYTGTILATPNIPEWQNFPLASKLSQHFGVPAYLDNDANMAGLAEWQYGAGLAISDPSVLIFGGGVSQVGDYLCKPFEESLRELAFHPYYLDNLVITRAALGDEAGLLGALALARMKSK